MVRSETPVRRSLQEEAPSSRTISSVPQPTLSTGVEPVQASLSLRGIARRLNIHIDAGEEGMATAAQPRLKQSSSGSTRRKASLAEFQSSNSKISPTFWKIIFVTTQLAFLLVAYIHAWWHGELDFKNLHVSGVLDDSRRSLMCAAISLTSMWALTGIEVSRSVKALKTERIFLARGTCYGIAGVCLVRESQFFVFHGVFAVIAFGFAWMLVAANTLCHPGSWKAVTTLSILSCVTATLQGSSVLHNLGYDFLPFFGNTVLAIGEWTMILIFDLCVVFVGKGQ